MDNVIEPRTSSAETARNRVDRADYLIIALVSCSVLLYEIAITRLLSVVLWYHFAFLAVSLAMLALGAPGVWFSIRAPSRTNLRGFLLAAAVAIPASIATVVRIGDWLPPFGSPVEILGLEFAGEHVRTAGTVLALLTPLLLQGCVVCLLLIQAPGKQVARMYAADLLGATIGAAAVVPLLWTISTPALLAATGLLPLAAAWIAAPRRPILPLALATVLLLVVVWGEPFQVRHNKLYREGSFELLYEKWTPTARLTVFPTIFWNTDPQLAFGWGMGSRFKGEKIDQLWIEQDSTAGTAITRFTRRPEEVDHLLFDVTSVGYQLRHPERVCIIGAGGGRDILTAWRAGAERIDAVELNAAMIDIVSDLFVDFSGDVYHLPGVEGFASEGRSFLTRTESHYDLIQISMIDSFAATAAGAYALSENYLYTIEALQLYWKRLTDTGMISISRWMRVRQSLEGARLMRLAVEALEAEGVADPRRHLAAIQGGALVTLLISRTPFDAAAIAELDAIATRRGFVRHWPPPRSAPRDSLVIEVLTRGTTALEARGLNLTAPTDDRPFFFQNVRAFSHVDRDIVARLSINDQAALLPRALLGSVGLLTAGLFFAPFALAGRLRRHPLFWRGSGYFLAVGLGFMSVEMPLIQKLILYLGHPSYATTVVLSTLLLGSGLGSLTASWADLGRMIRLRWALPAAIVAVAVLLPELRGPSLGWPLALRIALSVAVLVPVGFCLGFAFPAGMIRFGEGNRAWFWAINGAAGVLASAGSFALAAYVGLSGVLWMGVACYALACVLLPRGDAE